MPVSGNNELVDRISELSNQAAGNTGIEIAEVQLRGAGNARLLRIYIDKPGGVTHGDCELVSERVSALLDEHDLIPDAYTLEVSSLGAERKLNKPRDFERVIGQKVALVLRTPLEGRGRLEGRLLAVEESGLELEISPGHRHRIALDQVGKAKLKFEP